MVGQAAAATREDEAAAIAANQSAARAALVEEVDEWLAGVVAQEVAETRGAGRGLVAESLGPGAAEAEAAEQIVFAVDTVCSAENYPAASLPASVRGSAAGKDSNSAVLGLALDPAAERCPIEGLAQSEG